MIKIFLFIPFISFVFSSFFFSTAQSQILKFKKPKKQKAFPLISSGSNRYNYFTDKIGQDIYRFKDGEPVLGPEKTKEEQELYRKRIKYTLLKRKSKKTGLSPEFMETQDNFFDVENIGEKEKSESLKRLKKYKTLKPPAPKPVPKKPSSKLRPIIGPYYEPAEKADKPEIKKSPSTKEKSVPVV